VILVTNNMMSENGDNALEGHVKDSEYAKSQSCIIVLTCIASQQNKWRKKKMKSSNAKQPLGIYNSSATLASFLMFLFTIWISSHDLTHHQSMSWSINQCHIARRRNSSDHILIILHYPASLWLHYHITSPSPNVSAIPPHCFLLVSHKTIL